MEPFLLQPFLGGFPKPTGFWNKLKCSLLTISKTGGVAKKNPVQNSNSPFNQKQTRIFAPIFRNVTLKSLLFFAGKKNF
jgi:hypothetical protein